MKELIESCFNRLQSLDIAPTQSNMEKLLQTLYDLKEVYKAICKEVETDERQTADLE